MKGSLEVPFRSAALKLVPAQFHPVGADPEHEWALSRGRERVLLSLVVLVGVSVGAYVVFTDISSLVHHHAQIAAGR
jgi:hypothetical protein